MVLDLLRCLVIVVVELLIEVYVSNNLSLLLSPQGDRKIYRSELRFFSSAISPTFLLSLIFQLQMSFHLLYPPCALRKPARKKEHTLEGIITFKW